MAVLKNKTQKNFTMISNNILRDKELSLKNRGLLCTLCSLPDGWDFSIAGLSAIIPDGKDAIRNSLFDLENIGYIKRTLTRGVDGKFVSEIEVFSERTAPKNSPCRNSRVGKPDTANPTRLIRHGSSDTENPTEYNTDNIKRTINNDNDKSISQSEEDSLIDREKEINAYKELIAENIKLDWLLDIADRQSEAETTMVHEIYDVICDMVCYPRESVIIKNTTYPWEVVKSQFLKLRYEHIGGILNRLVDKDLGIKNMSSYLISTLYSASLVGTLEAQANLHDDYLKFLRGNPY